MRIQRLCFLHNLWRKGKEFGVYAIWICKEQYEKEPWNCKHNESLKVQQPLTNNIHEIPLVRELKITCCTLNHHPSKQKIGNFIPCYVKTQKFTESDIYEILVHLPHQSLSLVLQMLLCEFTDNIKEHGKYLQIDIKHPLLGSYHILAHIISRDTNISFTSRVEGKKKKKTWKDKPPTRFLFLLFFFFWSTISDSPKSFQTRKQSLRLGKFVDLNRFVWFSINHVFCWRNFLVLKYL